MLLDSASMYFRAFHGVPESVVSPDGTPVGAVRGFIDAGFSKFVVLPMAEPDPDALPEHLAWLAGEILDLQN